MKELKKIVIKVFILLLPFSIYYIGYNYYLIATKLKSDNASIYNAIKNSKKKLSKKKMVFGDSVGDQLYPNNIDYKSMDMISLTTTAPSSLVGIYIMIQNLLKNNDLNGKELFYIVVPGSFDEDLLGQYTYNHFLKPFYTCKNKKYLTEKVKISINKIPYNWASQIPFIKNSNWQPEFKYKSNYKLLISSIYIEYLKMIKDLARINHFSFKIIMPMIREDEKKINYSTMISQIHQYKLEDIFTGYFENIKYLDIKEFHENSNHYLNPQKYGLNPLNL